jgi:predicted nucleotidyltransferase
MSTANSIDPEKLKLIREQLEQIERAHDIAILHASEAGSRGWGFASEHSDFDVRFIYVHRLPWYLKVLGRGETRKDTIEQPVEGDLDLGGWELSKALGLFKSGNAEFVEWMDSPIVYRSDDQFTARMRQLVVELHQPVPSFFHYLNMGRRNFTQFERTPSPKAFLYALRPALSARWLADGQGPLPMDFDKIRARTVPDPDLQKSIDRLVQAKRQGADATGGQPEAALVAHTTTTLSELGELRLYDHLRRDFGPLDDLLYEQVSRFSSRS